MNFSRGIVLLSFLLVFAGGTLAQDSLLGKKKGSGSGGSSNSGSSSSSSKSGSSGKSNSSGQKKQESTASRTDQRSSDQMHFDTPLINKQRPKAPSRSGRVNYGTQNNLLNKGDKPRTPVNISPAPSRQFLDNETASMRDQMRREDRSRVRDRDWNRDGRGHRDWDREDYRWGKFRVGYYQYDRGFRDDQFCYPYYVFNPYQVDNCIASPWYYYSYLPPYINCTRLVVLTEYTGLFSGFPYDYYPPSRNRSDYETRGGGFDGNYMSRRNLDYTIDDIVDAFMQQDRRAVDRLVPRYGTVALAVDGTSSYGVRSDDFYDMLMDAVMNSRTISYEIINVMHNNDQAMVTARHDYLDSWGQRQCVYHKFELAGERGGNVIRYFETTNRLNW